MRRLATVLTAAVVAAFSAGPTTASENIIAAFSAVDTNGNGVIDIDEYVAHVRGLFNDLDADDSQTLSPAELPNIDRARFDRGDRDGDGVISVAEAKAERVLFFYQSDASGDGVLSIEEVLGAERN